MNTDELLAQLSEGVRQMRSELQTVIEQQTPTSPWIPPRKFATLLNVSVKAIAAWRHKGRFAPKVSVPFNAATTLTGSITASTLSRTSNMTIMSRFTPSSNSALQAELTAVIDAVGIEWRYQSTTSMMRSVSIPHLQTMSLTYDPLQFINWATHLNLPSLLMRCTSQIPISEVRTTNEQHPQWQQASPAGSRVPTDLLPPAIRYEAARAVFFEDWGNLHPRQRLPGPQASLRTKSHGRVLRPRANLAPRLRAKHPHRWGA